MARERIHRRSVASPVKRRGASWPALADRLSGIVPLARLEPAALAALRTCPASERIAIACSGGADSVALTLLLWALLPERRGAWVVFHFNHRLRGRASAGDAAFVRNLAHGLGEQAAQGRWEERPKHVEGISEAAARDARMAFFLESMNRFACRMIAFGHHANDVAETMLMRLTRGSGTGGLCAPRPVQTVGNGFTRVRPLLGFPAGEIREAVRTCRIPWREDASNDSARFFRNRVRAAVVPALLGTSEQDALAGIGRSRALIEDDDEALEAWLDSLIPALQVSAPLDLAPLAGKPRALFRRAILGWLSFEGVAGFLSRTAIEPLVAAAFSGQEHRLSAGGSGQISLDRGVLRLDPDVRLKSAPSGRPWSWNETAHAWISADEKRIEICLQRQTDRLRRKISERKISPDREAFVDAEHLDVARLFVRTWKPGDRYRPLGSPGRKKLQDMFVDARVPREQRSKLPVVCMSRGDIIWVPGFAPAESLAVRPSSKLVVQLTYS